MPLSPDRGTGLEYSDDGSLSDMTQDSLIQAYKDQAWDLVGLLPGTEGLRLKAIRCLGEKGLPNRKTEDWRYSNISALTATAFNWMDKAEAPTPDINWLVQDASARFVFVNGRFSEDLSELGTAWQQARVRVLANHLMSNMQRAEGLLQDRDGIELLNTALMRDGMVISLPAGNIVDDPVEILHISTGRDHTAQHIRHLIELGEGASCTVVERFIGGDAAYWTNSMTHIRVCENAHLNHIRFQEEGPRALHTSKAVADIDADGSYSATAFSVGGAVARFENHVTLKGEGARACVDGVALAGNSSSHDSLNHINHMVPNATSDQIFRTVADARSTTSFQGKVTVAKDAQKTNADQSFKALLLDRSAVANAKPELEIFADDVKCSHGATVGELDAAALFYMASRGVEPDVARRLLVEAFAGDALTRLEEGRLKEDLMAKIMAWMTRHMSQSSIPGTASGKNVNE